MSTSASYDSALTKLASELVNNHFHVSLYKDKNAFEKIFGTTAKCHEPSRNILIVGAGASKNSHESFMLSQQILENMCFNELKLDTLIGSNPKSTLKFREQAAVAANHRYAGWNSVKDILEKLIATLPFEDCLQLFSQFTTAEDLSSSLKNSIVGQLSEGPTRSSSLTVFEHLPSLLYEIIAHLFKHRYIDVIINMNFDEMLDNAIEDEMGDSTYYKIVNDSDVKRLREIVDENRLRIPIYIKPHGTFRSYSSMRFTHDRYLTHPTPLNLLFDDIFSGSTSQPEFTTVKRINVMTVGYSFSDVDIHIPIFEQFAKKYIKNARTIHMTYRGVDELNFYLFNRNSTGGKNVLDAFKTWFELEYPNYKPDDPAINLYDSMFLALKESINIISCEGVPVSEKVGSFGTLFDELYKKIESSFLKNAPYVPKGITRHKLLTRLFDKSYVGDGLSGNDGYLLETSYDYFYKQACFHAVYALIKFKGHIPLNEVTHNRPGKYFLLYLRAIENHPNDLIRAKTKANMITYLQQLVAKADCSIVRSVEYLDCVHIDEKKTWNDFYKTISAVVVEEIVNKSENAHSSDFARELTDLMETTTMGKSRREINAIYNDKRHGIFHPFKRSCIINTNLEFTYRFFDIASKDDWGTMCMIDDSGKPIYNLYNYSTATDCQLERLKDRKIYLLRTSDDTSGYDKRTGNASTDIVEKMEAILGDSFHSEKTSPGNNVHKMALYLDDENIPLYGIYFFQPNTKSRINPVHFERLQDAKNLSIMLELFISCMGDTWKDTFKPIKPKRV